MQIFYCFKTTLLCSDHCDWVDVKDLSFTNLKTETCQHEFMNIFLPAENLNMKNMLQGKSYAR